MAYVDDFMSEMQGEWDGLVGSLDNPLIPGGSVASSVLSIVPETTGAGVIASPAGQTMMGVGKGVSAAPGAVASAASSLAPAKSTITLYIVAGIVLLLLLGKVEAL